jgi:hypothetical protein
MIGAESTDMEIRVVNSFPEQALDLSAAYRVQFQTMGELSNELSNFYDVVGVTDPFQYIDVNARKLFGRRFSLGAGYYQRFLLNGKDESEFNREYLRLFAVFGMEDLPVSGLSFDIDGDFWKTGADQLYSAGLSAGYEFKVREKKASLGIGTYFSLYKYDRYDQQGESENVQTYYVRCKVPVGREFAVDGRYEYESGPENYHVLHASLCYEF